MKTERTFIGVCTDENHGIIQSGFETITFSVTTTEVEKAKKSKKALGDVRSFLKFGYTYLVAFSETRIDGEESVSSFTQLLYITHFEIIRNTISFGNKDIDITVRIGCV